jgi:hypothetical protein
VEGVENKEKPKEHEKTREKAHDELEGDNLKLPISYIKTE